MSGANAIPFQLTEDAIATAFVSDRMGFAGGQYVIAYLTDDPDFNNILGLQDDSQLTNLLLFCDRQTNNRELVKGNYYVFPGAAGLGGFVQLQLTTSAELSAILP